MGKIIYQPKGKVTEAWEGIGGFEGLYKVSSFGRILSLPRFGTKNEAKILKLHVSKRYGYANVCLCKNNHKVLRRVNRLVAIAFIPNPNNLPEVNHKDGNKLNNNVSNLEWCTNSYNKIHAYKIGLMSAVGERNGQSKLNEAQVRDIRALLAVNANQRLLAKRFGISQQTVSEIKMRKIWSHLEVDSNYSMFAD